MEKVASFYPNELGMRLHTVYDDNPKRRNVFDKLKRVHWNMLQIREILYTEDCLDAIELLIFNPGLQELLILDPDKCKNKRFSTQTYLLKFIRPNERKNTLADIKRLKDLGYTPKHISPRIEVIK